MATRRNFPSELKPSARTYSPGVYPSASFESLDGTKTHIRFSDRRVNATLNLTFSNVSDRDAAKILDNYELVNKNWDYVSFGSNDALAGTGVETINDNGSISRSDYLLDYMKEEDNKTLRVNHNIADPSGLKWRYSAPPVVTSVFPGFSNVSCSFVACLDPE